MNPRKELQILGLMAAVFGRGYFLPLGTPRFVQEALALTKWYARDHVILSLLPAFCCSPGRRSVCPA